MRHLVTPPDQVHTVIIFKAARSGSTFFSDFATELGNQAKLKVATHFEPFCLKSCLETSRDVQEAAFASLLSRCDYKICSPRKWQSPCLPNQATKCDPTPHRLCGQDEVNMSITAFNGRFSFGVRWPKLAPRLLPKASAIIINLRRTNLIAMAYSKHQHSGCDTTGQNTTLGLLFGLSMLLQCSWSYAVGDQEYASSQALEAATASGAALHLFIYEDFLADPEHMQRQIALAILGHELPRKVYTKQQKLHTLNSLCGYSDVVCAETAPRGDQLQSSSRRVAIDESKEPIKRHLAGLSSARYPCLMRQWLAEPQVAFTVPCSAVGTIDLAGYCSPLQSTPWSRSLEELYR
jgi:hypothetical protein